MIMIVDYGAGNITSVKRAIDHVGRACMLASDSSAIERAERIIVPGVGHFCATAALGANGLGAAVSRQITNGKPVLGICLGMQWLFQSSAEAPDIPGLAIFPAACQSFPDTVKSPHVGWNQLEIHGKSRLLRGIPNGQFTYFTHSYYAPCVDATVAWCDYSGGFSAAVERGNLFGVQFHPEKSGDVGLAILENFCRC